MKTSRQQVVICDNGTGVCVVIVFLMKHDPIQYCRPYADLILGFCSLSNVVLLETTFRGHPSPVWLAGLCYVLKRVLVSASSR